MHSVITRKELCTGSFCRELSETRYLLLVAWLGIVAVFGQKLSIGQTFENNRESISFDKNSARMIAKQVRRDGVTAVIDLRQLPGILPDLVDSLLSQDSIVRHAAARAISYAALKMERNAFLGKEIPRWEVLEDPFETALLRLSNHSVYHREQRQVERLIRRMNSGQLSARKPWVSTHKLPQHHEAFLSELAKLQSHRVPEMLHIIETHAKRYDRRQRVGLFHELCKIVPPSLVEIMLVSSDNYDDEIIDAITTISLVEEESSLQVLLESACPRLRITRQKLSELILHPKSSPSLCLSALECLANCHDLEPELARRLARQFSAESIEPRNDSSYWNAWANFLRAHRVAIGTETIDRIKRQSIARFLDERLQTDERSAWLSFLNEVFSRDQLVVDAILQSFLQSQPNSPLLSDLLASLPAHGSLIKKAKERLLHLAMSGEDYNRYLAWGALAHIDDLNQAEMDRLIQLICNPQEHELTKANAARVLAVQGERAVEPLRKGLQKAMSNLSAPCLHAMLRTIEQCGQPDPLLDNTLRSIIKQASIGLSERVAAWYARSATAEATDRTTIDIRIFLEDEENEPEARAAALLTLARVCGACAVPILTRHTHDNSSLVRQSARYAHHLAGESNTAVHLLMSEFLQCEEDDSQNLIQQLMGEIGSAGQKAMRIILQAPSSTLAQKQIAYRSLAASGSATWRELIPWIDDSQSGELFEESARAVWNFDRELVPALYNRILEIAPETPLASRLWRFAEDTTMGLGVGNDKKAWSDSVMAQAILQSVARGPNKDSLAVSPEPATKTLPAPQTIAESTPPAPSQSEQSAKVDALSSFRTVEKSRAASDRAVSVFYGTNRQTKVLPSVGASIRWGAFAISLICFLVCVIAFSKQRSMRYAFIALLGLLGLTAMARDSLDIAYWFPDRAGLYSGDYSTEIKYGVCEVTIPPNHVPGELESPNFLMTLQVSPDPDKHIVLKRTIPLDKKHFFTQLHNCLQEKGKNLLVFIHGYNVSFEDAARRTAQMSFDLKFQGAPVFYSWPSYSNWYRYSDDASNIERSVDQIRDFLQQLANDSGAESINVVAHSMGNLGFTQALAGMQTTGPVFNQVVLAAPDIDVQVFREEIAPRITNKAKRFTLYTSQTDLALVASRFFNRGERLGDSSLGAFSLAGIDTIDATSVDTSLLGHSYYGSNINVLDDISHLLTGKPIQARPLLQFQAQANPPHWSFAVQTRTAESTSIKRQ